MMIGNKRIITAGCSFSDPDTPYTWVKLFEKHIKRLYSNVTFDHRGLSSQGQQLIQKKSIHAIHQALSEGYNPEDICVIVMWSGHDRRSWYIDDADIMNRILTHWKKQNLVAFQLQFGDLSNKCDELVVLGEYTNPLKHYVPYNKKGGWYINSKTFDELSFFKEYFMFSSYLESIIVSLENMIMLQSFCKLKNIKLYEQFYMDYVYDQILKFKDHKEVRHLYDFFDTTNYISLSSIHGYLKQLETQPAQYFRTEIDPHPNLDGHLVWLDQVLLPALEKNNFYSEFINGKQRTNVA